MARAHRHFLPNQVWHITHRCHQDAHGQWLETALIINTHQRESFWSNSVAVGSENFIEKIHMELGVLAHGRSCQPVGEQFILKEPDATYDVTFGPKRPF